MARASSPAVAWVDQTRLVADDVESSGESGHFGSAITYGVEGGVTTVVVGAPHDEAPEDAADSTEPGAAYVIELDGGVWTPRQKLVASDGLDGDDFGRSVALSGDTLVVGAPARSRGAVGAVYVFERAGGTWSETQKLMASDATADDFVGWSVALDGDTLVVGAPARVFGETDHGNGAAYVFRRGGGVFTEAQKLTAADGEIADGFAEALALDGAWLALGAKWERDGASFFSGPGAVYFFEEVAGVWTERQKLRSADASGFYGEALAMQGDVVAVGNQSVVLNDPYTHLGAVYVVENVAGTWVEQQRIEEDVPSFFGGHFGWAVALHDGVLVTSARDREEAFVYTSSGGTWSPDHTLGPALPAPLDHFGRALAVAPGLVLVGAPLDDHESPHSNEGAVYARILVGGACSDDTMCGGDNCVDGYCCDAACDGPCAACDRPGQEGICAPVVHGTPAGPGCDPYVCNGVDRGCPERCNFDTDCVDGAFCDVSLGEPACRRRRSLGEACDRAEQCESGVCEDGVCCTSTCPGACSSCNVEGSAGTCSVVPEGEPGGCAPLLCDGTSSTCPESCTDATCASGFFCDPDSGMCTNSPPCDEVACAPYRCAETSICWTSCQTSAECAPGHVCNADSECMTAVAASPRDACSCDFAGARDEHWTGWGVMLLLLGARRRRR